MKIASSDIQMDSSHFSQTSHQLTESLRTWIGARSSEADTTPNAGRNLLTQNDAVQISAAARSAQSNEATAIQNSLDAIENDPRMRLIRAMIAMLTGQDVKVFNASDLSSAAPALPAAPATTAQSSPQAASGNAAATPAPAGYGIEYERHETYSEAEQTHFQASGTIRTADGQEISFDLSLAMTRSYRQESNTTLRLGDARQTRDPLVINFSGTAAQLTSQRFKFDLNADGQSEDINFVKGGSGFLALDKNGDGKINDGTELFGAQSGNGFADLATLDSDHNGWIDENDPAYAQLRVWTKDASGGDHLSTLKQSGVGALNLASVSTPFAIKEPNNALLGRITSSGIYVGENGNIGSLQQVDLTV